MMGTVGPQMEAKQRPIGLKPHSEPTTKDLLLMAALLRTPAFTFAIPQSIGGTEASFGT